jgi:diaminopimelate decarboxylase
VSTPVRHAQNLSFPVVDNVLQVGGMPLTRLAERVGSTPFYAYDRRLLSERVAQLRAALPQDVHLHYAIKANPMPAVVQHMAGLVDGFDVASGGELKVVLDTTMPPLQISFAGPGKGERELRQAIAAGIVINLESVRELERIVMIATETGMRPKVAVRVNPDFELKSSGMKMGGGPKQFGIDAELVPDLLAQMKTLPVEFWGFHIFPGRRTSRPNPSSRPRPRLSTWRGAWRRMRRARSGC